MIPAHIYYSLTFLTVNNPPPMSGSLAVCYFCRGSDPQPVTFGRTEGSGSERKANETGYLCLWLFHRRKRQITLTLTLNESIISQHMQRAAACFSGLLIGGRAPLFRPTQDLKCCVLPRDALLLGDADSYHLWRVQHRIMSWPKLRGEKKCF